MPTVFNSALAPYPALGSRLRRLPRTATSSCLRQLGHASARTSIQHSLGHVAIGLFQIVVSTDVEPVLANQVSSDDLAPVHQRPNHFRGVAVLPRRDQVDGQRVEHI